MKNLAFSAILMLIACGILGKVATRKAQRFFQQVYLIETPQGDFFTYSAVENTYVQERKEDRITFERGARVYQFHAVRTFLGTQYYYRIRYKGEKHLDGVFDLFTAYQSASRLELISSSDCEVEMRTENDERIIFHLCQPIP